jgi:hypothetical protein
MAFNDTGETRGGDTEIQKLLKMSGGAPAPDADPQNYGGQRLDLLLGTSFAKGPFSYSIEGGIPVYGSLNGLQLRTSRLLTVGGQLMFQAIAPTKKPELFMAPANVSC